MQFLLFDVGATLVFLAAYLSAARLRRRRALGALSPRRQPARLASTR